MLCFGAFALWSKELVKLTLAAKAADAAIAGLQKLLPLISASVPHACLFQ